MIYCAPLVSQTLMISRKCIKYCAPQSSMVQVKKEQSMLKPGYHDTLMKKVDMANRILQFDVL